MKRVKAIWNSMRQRIEERWLKCVGWFLFIAAFVIMSRGIYLNWGDDNTAQSETVISSVTADTTFKASEIDVKARTETLLNFFVQTKSEYARFDQSREAIKWQMRAFFTATLIGLIGFYARNGQPHHQAPLTSGLLWICCSAIAFFYILDVHLADLNKRQDKDIPSINRTVDTLLTITPNNTVWLEKKPSQIVGDSTRVSRKIRTAFKPNLEQSIVYFLPLIFILGFMCLKKQSS